MHGKGCNTLIKHKHDPSQIVGIYLLEAGIIFHSGVRRKHRSSTAVQFWRAE